MDPAFVKRHPLPPIENERYIDLVFTHKSVNALPSGQVYEDEAGVDNERLALLGDSVIDLIVLETLVDTLPLSRRGDLDHKRSLLIRRDRVEQWSLAYGLPDMLRVHRAQKLVIPKNQNARVQVFQAYVGAVYKESGFEAVKSWLEYVVEEALNDIRATEDVEDLEDLDNAFCNMNMGGTNVTSPHSGTGSSKKASPPPPPSPPRAASDPPPRRKSTGSSQTSAPKSSSPASSSNKAPLMALNELASQKHIKLIWNDEREGEPHEPIFKFTVTFQGSREIMGRGTGSSKLIAKHQAAAEALKRLQAM